jgi:hypothetical protein
MDVSIQQVGNFEGTHTDNCIWHGMCLAVEIVDTRGDTGKGKFQCPKKKTDPQTDEPKTCQWLPTCETTTQPNVRLMVNKHGNGKPFTDDFLI